MGAHTTSNALHAPANPLRDGETLQQFLNRAERKPVPVHMWALKQYDPNEFAKWDELDTVHSVSDVLALESWYEHELGLAQAGVRAYCTLKLTVRGRGIGGAVYSRSVPVEFTGEEIALLRAVARPLAVAVSNALANEEIAHLRRQLQQENIALRAALGERSWFEGIVGDSRSLRAVLAQTEEVADTDATVLVTGETGTG